MIGVGVIGFGKMGRIRADVIKATGRGSVVAVYEPNDVEDAPCGASESPEAVISNPEVEAVFICTPNHLNQRLTIEALNTGKHVFCEKPPAFSAAGVEEIRAAEEASGRKLMYGFNHRHHGSIKHMKLLIESGEYGEVLWMRGRYGKSVDESFYEQWRAAPDQAGGGILLDQGIHMVDLFLHLGGRFDQVEAFVSSLYWGMDIEDNVFAIFRNSDTGRVASLHSTMTQWRHLFSLEVFLSKGYLVLNGLRTASKTYGDEVLSIAKNRTTAPAATWEDEERITFHDDTSWRSEVDHFFDTIESDVPVEIGTSADALELMTLIDTIYERGRKW
jgi:1,5-anhydro-D-fructose reductase (1,5-anhydro-D-mannitol-forming)